VRVDWDATRYVERLSKKSTRSSSAEAAEARLRQRFPPLDRLAAGHTISSPCIVVDMDNIILAWYLPGILDASRQVSFCI
jgi:hypothetical protein